MVPQQRLSLEQRPGLRQPLLLLRRLLCQSEDRTLLLVWAWACCCPLHNLPMPDVRNSARDLLCPLQVGVATRNGTEAVVHTARHWAQRHAGQAEQVLLKIDFSNAFNTVDRASLLPRDSPPPARLVPLGRVVLCLSCFFCFLFFSCLLLLVLAFALLFALATSVTQKQHANISRMVPSPNVASCFLLWHLAFFFYPLPSSPHFSLAGLASRFFLLQLAFFLSSPLPLAAINCCSDALPASWKQQASGTPEPEAIDLQVVGGTFFTRARCQK